MRLRSCALAGLLLAAKTATPETARNPADDAEGTWPREEEIEHLRAGTAYVLDAGELEGNQGPSASASGTTDKKAGTSTPERSPNTASRTG